MMDNELEKALKKIKKCLALSESNNANESAIALKQANALMKKYNLTSEEIKLSEVKEKESKGCGSMKPPRYYTYLISCVCKAFSCENLYVLSRKNSKLTGNATFIGLAHKVETAAYIFDILYRDLKKKRKEYYDSILSSVRMPKSRGAKIRQADIFAESYCMQVYHTVANFAKTDQEESLLKEYMEKKNTKTLKIPPRQLSAGDRGAVTAGEMAAQDVKLYHGVNETKQVRIGG